MTIWSISIKESNIIYDFLIGLTNYLKDEKSVEMVLQNSFVKRKKTITLIVVIVLMNFYKKLIDYIYAI